MRRIYDSLDFLAQLMAVTCGLDTGFLSRSVLFRGRAAGRLKGGEMKKKEFIKLILCFLLAAIPFGWAYGGEISFIAPESTVSALSFSRPTSPGEITISFNGMVTLNGTPIEKMSHPEIKEIMSKILVEMQKSNIETFRYYEQQTEYLLKEIGFVRELLRQCKENKK